jgi:glutamate dehydrogenase/leucine dehydrogenase
MGRDITWWPHERVVVHHEPESGLRAIVAVHSTVLGPGLGGLRIRSYAGVDDALEDVLRLSQAMTFKAAAAGLDLGGGKAVILDDGEGDRIARLEAFAALVASLGGAYITAEDIGTTTADLDLIAEHTPYAVGLSPERGGGGDPSPSTAMTVFGAIEHAVRVRLGSSSLDGVSVGVLGLGKVGLDLARRVVAAGAKLLVADLDAALAERTAGELGAVVAEPDALVTADVDVLAPCAVGGLVTAEVADALRASVVAGAANNILADDDVAARLAARKVLYVPDFLTNSGGLIHCSDELHDFDPQRVARRLDAAVQRVGQVLDEAAATDRTPLEVATAHALERLGQPRPVA